MHVERSVGAQIGAKGRRGKNMRRAIMANLTLRPAQTRLSTGTELTWAATAANCTGIYNNRFAAWGIP